MRKKGFWEGRAPRERFLSGGNLLGQTGPEKKNGRFPPKDGSVKKREGQGVGVVKGDGGNVDENAECRGFSEFRKREKKSQRPVSRGGPPIVGASHDQSWGKGEGGKKKKKKNSKATSKGKRHGRHNRKVEAGGACGDHRLGNS